MSDLLWNTEGPVRSFGIDVPCFIDQQITPATVAAILQGGCSSGAYMPAVTYWQALATMGEHGDEVMQAVEDSGWELTADMITGASWGGIAVLFLSLAVEAWAHNVAPILEASIKAQG